METEELCNKDVDFAPGGALLGLSATTSCGENLCAGSCGAGWPAAQPLRGTSVSRVLPMRPPSISSRRRFIRVRPLACRDMAKYIYIRVELNSTWQHCSPCHEGGGLKNKDKPTRNENLHSYMAGLVLSNPCMQACMCHHTPQQACTCPPTAAHLCLLW